MTPNAAHEDALAINDIVETTKGAKFWGRIIGLHGLGVAEKPGAVVEAIEDGFAGTRHVYPLAQLRRRAAPIPQDRAGLIERTDRAIGEAEIQAAGNSDNYLIAAFIDIKDALRAERQDHPAGSGEAVPVGWQNGEREVARRWLADLLARLSSKPDHADDCLWLIRLNTLLYASPIPEGNEDEWKRQAYILHDRVQKLEMLLGSTPPVPDGYISVPKSALAWLFGEGTDADGKWFHEVQDAFSIIKFIGKQPPYWWRPHFRKLIEASPAVHAEAAEKADGENFYVNEDATPLEQSSPPPATGMDRVRVKPHAIAWMGYWPGAGSVDSETRTTHHERVAKQWDEDGAQVTPLAALSLQPASGRAEERGWLVELKGQRPSWWALAAEEGEAAFTYDSHAALRFARKIDAETFIADAGWTEAFASEHMWVDPPARTLTPSEAKDGQ